MEEQILDGEPQHIFFDDTCGICTGEIAEDEPTLEFMCFHKAHTRCLYRAIAENNVAAFACTRCDNDRDGIAAEVGEEELPERVPEVERIPMRDQIEEEFNTNPEFRNDLKKLLNASTDYRKKRTLLAKTIKELKHRHRPEVELIRNSLSQVKRTVHQEITSSNDFKEARKAYNRVSNYRSLINRKYEYTFSEIRRIVGRKRGFRRLRSYHRYYRSPARMAFWALYFRIKF